MDNHTQQCTWLVATAGQAVLRSNDRGATWRRIGLRMDLEFDAVVRCLLTDPAEPSTVLAGAGVGLCRSDDAGVTWRRIDTAMNDQQIWKMIRDPNDPATIFAGTGAPSRARLFRSHDSGATWQCIGPEIPEFCAGVNRPRLLALAVDPTDSNHVWFGVEEGGAWRSLDRGDSFERMDDPSGGLERSDIHAVHILPGPPRTVVVMADFCVYVTHDDAASWTAMPATKTFGWRYARSMELHQADPNVLFMGMGDGTPGTKSAIFRSADLGDNWQRQEVAIRPSSTIWSIGSHAADADMMLFGTKYGDLYSSADGGANWDKQWRTFPEITAVAWVPARCPEPAEAH